MSGGRPPLGPAIVEGLDAPEEAKRRLRVILEVNAGTRSVEEACRELGLERARFYELQRRALGAALESLEPRPSGRPPTPPPSVAEERIRSLEAQLTDAKLDLHASEIRREIAEVMPHLLKKEGSQPEKKRRRRRPY